MVGFAWNALREAFCGEQTACLLALTYETLTTQPEQAIAAVYDFIGEKPFAHDFKNIEFDAEEFDRRIGTPGLHKVGRQRGSHRAQDRAAGRLCAQIRERCVLARSRTQPEQGEGGLEEVRILGFAFSLEFLLLTADGSLWKSEVNPQRQQRLLCPASPSIGSRSPLQALSNVSGLVTR